MPVIMSVILEEVELDKTTWELERTFQFHGTNET